MAEVGRVTPAKPIWPGHHGGEAVERVTPGNDDEQRKKKRQPGEQGTGSGSHPEDDRPGHVDEYV